MGSDNQTYRYAAFISYRHVEPDRKWAKWLHSSLESYRVPRRLVEQLGVPRRLSRVFRDEEELPASADLNQEIESALRESRFLIVVCSPRTPASEWVNKEVVRFREMGRGDQILALLIEGNPRESFPAALREIRRTITDESGIEREKIEQIEPLAADVRDASRTTGGHFGKMARLRLLASILGCRFDDLRRREQERQTRRAAFAGIAVTSLVTVIAGLAVFSVLQRARAERAEVDARVAKQSRISQHIRDGSDPWNEIKHERDPAVSMLQTAPALKLENDPVKEWGHRVRAASYFHLLPRLIAVEADPAPARLPDTYDPLRENPPTPPSHPELAGSDPAWFDTGVQIINHLEEDRKKDYFEAVPLDERGKALSRVRHTQWINEAHLSSDRHRLLTASRDYTAKIWDVATGKNLITNKHPREVQCCVWSRDDRLAASGSWDGAAHVWETENGREVLAVTPGQVMSVAFSSDSRLLATGSYNGNVYVWDISKRLPVGDAGHCDGPVTHVAFSGDDKSVFTCSKDGTLRLWDATTGKPKGAPLHHPDAVLDLHLDAPNHRFITRCQDGICRIYEDAGREAGPIQTFPDEELEVVGFSNGGKEITTGGKNGLKVWQVSDGKLLWSVTGAGRPLAISEDGSRAILSKDLASFQFCDIARRHAPGPLIACPKIQSGTISNDGRIACIIEEVIHEGSIVHLWNTDRGAEVVTLKHAGGVYGYVGFNPDGTRFTTACTDGQAMQWDVATGRQLYQTMTHSHAVGVARYNSSGNMLVTCSWDDTAGIWHSDGSPWGDALAHPGPVMDADFSPDSALLATGSEDHTLRVWSLATHKEIFPPVQRRGQVGGVIFSPDGRCVLSLSDGTALLTEVATGQPLAPPFPLSANGTGRRNSWFDGRGHLLAADRAGTQEWDFNPLDLPPDDIKQLAELLACARLDDAGSVRPISSQEWLKRWKHLSAAYPKLFQPIARHEPDGRSPAFGN